MSASVFGLKNNPEFIRNLRIELRPKRMLTAGIISAVIGLIVLPSIPGLNSQPSVNPSMPIPSYALAVLWIQKVTLILGGAFSCIRTIRRERELNTFDYQRVTRLSPLELGLGKLFGAPALSYFVTLCFLPPALFSAAASGGSVLFLLQEYVVLVIQAVAVHSLALLLSMVLDRGGALGSLALLFLLQWLGLVGWMAMYSTARTRSPYSPMPQFYGLRIPLQLLSSVIAIGFTAWLLLAIVRNIKRDPETVELYTSAQSLGLAGYCTFVWMGFLPWSTAIPVETQGALLFWNAAIFYLVGISLLRSRESFRRRLRTEGYAELATLRLLGPLPGLLAGALFVGILIVGLARGGVTEAAAANTYFGFFKALYFAAWVARDLYYLQWMKMRATRSPLRKALLYLLIYYIAVSTLLRTGFASSEPNLLPFMSGFVPLPLLRDLRPNVWQPAVAMWIFALLMQVALAAVFLYFKRGELRSRLGQRRRVAPAAPPQSPAVVS